jgi:hypothetical protein
MAAIWEASCETDGAGPNGTAGWLPQGAISPLSAKKFPVRLRIVQSDDGFFLCSESESPGFTAGDTWHQSAADAMAQAEFQFGVAAAGWRRVAV